MRVVIALALALAMSGCGRLGFSASSDAAGDGAATPDGPSATSCKTLASTCGPGGTDPCCTSLVVTGGTFARGHDVATDGSYPDASYGATLSDFRLDKYEVTVGRFRKFVEAGGGTQANPPSAGTGAHPNIAGSGWDSSWNGSLAVDTATLLAGVGAGSYQTWTNTPSSNEDRPINNITWYEAMAFCVWDGGFLPTEAEWNYTAVGGNEQRAYPWSNPPSSVVIDQTRATSNCDADPMIGCTVTDLALVGTLPAGDGRWGHSEMAGNVAEWALDWYTVPYPSPCNDCANLTVGTITNRLVLGGSFDLGVSGLRAANRNSYPPTGRVSEFGARCARL